MLVLLFFLVGGLSFQEKGIKWHTVEIAVINLIAVYPWNVRKKIGEHIQYQKLKFVRIVVAIYVAIQKNPGQGQVFRR